MNELDYLCVAVVGLSALWAVIRGFVRELVALIGWIAAIFLSATFSKAFGERLGSWIHFSVNLEYVASFLIFAAVLLVFALLGRWIKHGRAGRGGSLGDRMGGLVFGLVRGGLILVVAFAVHDAMGAPASRWTDGSLLYAYGKKGIMVVTNHLMN
ncbi:MAG: CvpA family protein [Magnetococcales bacterium]|nr:CvpA family protein [Magnetococcales bacterium]